MREDKIIIIIGFIVSVVAFLYGQVNYYIFWISFLIEFSSGENEGWNFEAILKWWELQRAWNLSQNFLVSDKLKPDFEAGTG